MPVCQLGLYRGYPSLLGIRIFVEKKPIFTKDKDILSIILRIKDISLHLEDLGINRKYGRDRISITQIHVRYPVIVIW